MKSEVIGRSGGMKNPNDHAEPTKVERKKINKYGFRIDYRSASDVIV